MISFYEFVWRFTSIKTFLEVLGIHLNSFKKFW